MDDDFLPRRLGPMSNKPRLPTVPPTSAAKGPAAVEIGGPKGPEPTRYGDWQFEGRCTDF